jgi:hypothetical protein
MRQITTQSPVKRLLPRNLPKCRIAPAIMIAKDSVDAKPGIMAANSRTPAKERVDVT